MNWIDALLVAVLLLFGWHGARKGFLALFLELSGFAISLTGALVLYPPISRFLQDTFRSSPNVGKALGFLLLFIVIESLYFWLARKLYRRIPEPVRNSNVNRALGAIPGAIEGLVICALFLSLLVILPAPGLPREAILKSQFGSLLVDEASAVEQRASDLFGGAIHDTFTLLTIHPKSNERVALPFRTTDVQVDHAAEQEMLRLVNRERTERGLVPLTWDPRLQAAAEAHSRDMLARGYFAHITPEGVTPEQRMARAGARFLVSGENLALAPDVAIAHNGLMHSPGHRANILYPNFRRVGIGAISAPPYGMMFTENFAN